MSAYKNALAVDDTSTDHRLALAVSLLASFDGVVLLERRLALRSTRSAIQCEIIDPMPGTHRCAEEFKVLVENASRMLAASKLGGMLPDKPLHWRVVEDNGTGTVELWPGAEEE